MKKSPDILIYTDGSSRGNPGPGGYGIIIQNFSDKRSKEFSKGFRKTTNNRMELLAVIEAIKKITVKNLTLHIYTDSKYVVDAEQAELTHKFLKGIDFLELDEALNAMSEVDPGGHFLGTKHTLENFERAFVIPELMNHDSFEQWEAEGGLDLNERAIKKAKKLLSDYEMPKLDPAINDELIEFIKKRELQLPDNVS